MIILLLILIGIFVIVMAFQIMGLFILLCAGVVIAILYFLIKKLSEWIDHRKVRQTLDKRD